MELRFAKECVSRGLPVFPAGSDKAPLTLHGFKDATLDKATIVGWWRDHPDALLAVPTGKESGLLCIDIDPAAEQWYAEHLIDLKCRRIHKTPRGYHLLYQMPETDVRCSSGKIAPGVDVRGIGGYVIWWPACGHEVVGDLNDIDRAPEWLIDKLKIRTNSRNSSPGNGGLKIAEGRRNDHLARTAGSLRGQGLELETIVIALQAENAARCDPPLPEDEVIKIGKSIVRYDERMAETADDEPEPLRRDLPPAPPYPLDALGAILGPAARRIAEVVQAPEAVCGQAVLAAASLAAQAHADIMIDGRRELLSLWHVTIAESGERKSAADNIALAPHRDHEKLTADQHRRDVAAHKDDEAVFEMARKAALREDDPNAALARLGTPPATPLKPWALVSSPTLEGLHKLYRDGQPSIGLFHDDGGEFLAGHSMAQDNRAKSVAGLAKLWDRGEFDRIRATDGMDKYYGRRLAMHLMIQPIIAETVLGDALLCGQGFLARCLLSWPETRIGVRAYVQESLDTDPALSAYRKATLALLEADRPVRPEAPQELASPTLQLAADAKTRWVALHDHIEASMVAGKELASVRAWGSKAPAQILRVAGVLTLFEDPAASLVRVTAMEQAAELVLHALEEAVRIIGTTDIPIETKHAQALLDWCHQSEIRRLHSGAALRLGPYALRTKAVFDVAIRTLERARWAVPIPGGAEVDGKHRQRVWDIR